MGKSRTRAAAVLAGVCVSVLGVTPAPVATAGPTAGPTAESRADHRPRVVKVHGRQIPVDAAAGRYRMKGKMIGKWQYNAVTPPLHTVDTLYVEAGTEVFRGCIDRNGNGRCGSRDWNGELHLGLIYWASFEDRDGDGKVDDLVRGQCVHPVTGGNGDFTGARGRIDMVDRPVGTEVRTRYRGTVILHAEDEPATPAYDWPSGATSGVSIAGPASSRRC